MRRLLLLAAFTLAAACGSNPTTNNPPPSPFAVTVEGTPTASTGGNGDVTIGIQLKVTEKSTGDTATNHLVILQVSVGTATPVPAMTTTFGRVAITWIVPAADATPGTVQSIAFCAPANGSGFCGTSLSGTQSYHHTF